MKRNPFRHVERLRVRGAEAGLHDTVFGSHHLAYFDAAMAGYWRAMAVPYRQAAAQLGGELILRKATLEFLSAARRDDLLDVGLRCSQAGESSLVFDAAVFRGDCALVEAQLTYVFADPAAQAPPTTQPAPAALRTLLRGFEAGEPMIELRIGGWSELGADAQPIRRSVFIEEQGIPADLEWDADDAGCIHAVAYNRLGAAVATGRLLEHAPGVARIGRMAVLQAVRGAALGRAILDALVAAARARGDREVLLHAQTSAAGFYARAGFAPRGAPFDEVGIAHVEMARAL